MQVGHEATSDWHINKNILGGIQEKVTIKMSKRNLYKHKVN